MIDIVFLLIIFFMTLPQLSRVVFHPVELPTVKNIDDDHQTQKITINVDQLGLFIVQGKQLSLPVLKSRLGDLLEDLGNEPSRLKVLVRADGRNDSGTVNELLVALKELGIQQVQLSARSLN